MLEKLFQSYCVRAGVSTKIFGIKVMLKRLLYFKSPLVAKQDMAFLDLVLRFPDEHKGFSEGAQGHRKWWLGAKPLPPCRYVTTKPKYDDLCSFLFVMGAHHLDIFEAYIHSSFSKDVQRLFVGTSSTEYSPKNSDVDPMDYSLVTEVLSKGWYPRLKVLWLGSTELLFNGTWSNGSVGDVTKLLKKMPNLSNLEISGFFKLNEPIELNHLTCLDIEVLHDLKRKACLEPSLDSVQNLLSSNFPKLKEAQYFLQCDGDLSRNPGYVFPDVFLDKCSHPSLRKLSLTGLFQKGEIKKLQQSRLGQNLETFYHDALEAYILMVHIERGRGLTFIKATAYTHTEHVNFTAQEVYEYQVDHIAGVCQIEPVYQSVVSLLKAYELFPALIVVRDDTFLLDNNGDTLGSGIFNQLSHRDNAPNVLEIMNTIGKAERSKVKTHQLGCKQWLYTKTSGYEDEYGDFVFDKWLESGVLDTMLQGQQFQADFH